MNFGRPRDWVGIGPPCDSSADYCRGILDTRRQKCRGSQRIGLALAGVGHNSADVRNGGQTPWALNSVTGSTHNLREPVPVSGQPLSGRHFANPGAPRDFFGLTQRIGL